LRPVGAAHRTSPGGRDRYPAGNRLPAQRALHEAGRSAAVNRAQHGDGRLSGQERPLELSALQFPEPSGRGPRRARRAGGSRGGAQGGGRVGRPRARGGDHRREGGRRHGTHHGGVGPAPAGRRHRMAAADGDRQDRRQPKDLETLRGLIRDADVFSQGYRPGTLGDRGLSAEALAQLRPGIVFVSLCAFGHVGPWAARRGFDTVVQTVSGITSRQGDLFPGSAPGPQFYPVSAIDYLTGYLMAFGAMVALARRAREGGSWLVRISLAQTGRWLIG